MLAAGIDIWIVYARDNTIIFVKLTKVGQNDIVTKNGLESFGEGNLIMKNKAFVIILSMFILVSGLNTYAHSGRTDSYGGHYVRTAGKGYPVGTYHYHSGPYTGYTVSYKGEVPEVFKAKKSEINEEQNLNIIQPVDEPIKENLVNTETETNKTITPQLAPKEQQPKAVEDKKINERVAEPVNSGSSSSSSSFFGYGTLAAIGSFIYFKSKNKV